MVGNLTDRPECQKIRVDKIKKSRPRQMLELLIWPEGQKENVKLQEHSAARKNSQNAYWSEIEVHCSPTYPDNSIGSHTEESAPARERVAASLMAPVGMGGHAPLLARQCSQLCNRSSCKMRLPFRCLEHRRRGRRSRRSPRSP